MSIPSDEPGRGGTPTGDPIMTAKFRIPGPQPWTVTRQRLVDRIIQGVRGPLTTVVAPAGSGKTVLAGCWAGAAPRSGPLAWLTLHEEDRRPGVLWSYVTAALGHAGVPVADVGTPAEPDAVPGSMLTRLAAVLAEPPEPVVLVLDNAQVLAGSEASATLDFLLRHAEPQLRLVLLGRGEPDLPLHRYRLAGSVTELCLDDLAFTAPEARELFAAHHADVGEAELTALVGYTRGWAAGLRLAARSIQSQSGTAERVDIQRDIGEYFAAEILDAQPAAIREFLLRSSVVERMWPGLVTVLTGQRDAPQTLATLARTNTFVTPDPDHPGGYGYHPIVRDLLRAQLAREAPQKIPPLHRKAAQWLADEGRIADAVAQAAGAGDWEYAAALLVEHNAIGALLTGTGAELFAGMPSDVDGPEAAVVQAVLALSVADPDLCAKHLVRAGELVGARLDGRHDALRLAVAVTEAELARRTGDLPGVASAVAGAEEGIARMRAENGVVPHELRALTLLCKGWARWRAGDLDPAGEALTEAFAFADLCDNERLRLDCVGELAIVEILRGRLRRAGEWGRRAGAVPDRSGAGGAWPVGVDVALAWVRAEESDVPAARRYTERAAARLAREPDPALAGLLAIVRTRVYRARGDLAGALGAIARARAEAADSVPGWLDERMAVTQAVLRAASGPAEPGPPVPDGVAPGTPRGLLALAHTELAGGTGTGTAVRLRAAVGQPEVPVDVQVEGWLVVATDELVRGHNEPARTALRRALRLAETEKLRRPLLEAPVPLRRFLRQERELGEQHAWLGGGMTGGAEARPADPRGAAHLGPGPLVEPLTAKETEVLRHLAALLSTEEIARAMFVSVNTVKTHIRSVLRKLAASRRNEAIRRAHDLRLI